MENLVEIARSFSYKLSVPGQYESRDFFCSQKAEVPESQAVKTSEALYEFCKTEVMKSVNKYLKEFETKPKIEKIPEPIVEENINFLKEIQEKDLPF